MYCVVHGPWHALYEKPAFPRSTSIVYSNCLSSPFCISSSLIHTSTDAVSPSSPSNREKLGVGIDTVAPNSVYCKENVVLGMN